MTSRRITISPVYVMLFTFIPSSLLGAYVVHEQNYMMVPTARVQLVVNFLFSTSVLYIFLLFFLSRVLHRIIRGLIGAFAERDNIRSGTEVYGTSLLLENILLKIDDRKWLSDLCGMRIVERKEEENEIRLKLNKHETNYYLSIYSEMTDSKVLFSLTPYELDENLAKKNIIVSEDCRLSLRHQIEEMKESFELKEIPESESSRIVRDSLNYAMSPARFPMIYRYRLQFSAIVVSVILSVLSISVYYTGLISLEILVGIIAIVVAIASAAINLLSRK